ncbi:MAG: arginine--tRNA ligase [Deltaproteobacteria bacterium]|nr:arginine--tRNA ligase [Deltaproteobacteria bacterium]MBT6432971.1 arginine--tRNA ligase [Deltaproteobacteria bacterium]MBT6488590.1 arginine--tRNA ligase [Deltaproteobacteria bacterium]
MPGMLPTLETIARQAILAGLETEADPVVRETNDPRFGHYQINGILPLAKTLKTNPRQLATKVMEKLEGNGMFLDPEIAGPGFINLRLSPAWLGETIGRFAADGERLGIDKIENPQNIVVDFSSPNVAKKMHVGHLRSTIIGDALVRVLRFVGHNVIGDNHVGDWGTQFGILIWAWRNKAENLNPDEATIADLEELYKAGSAASKDDEAIADACRSELAKLQSGDEENHKLWERFVAISRREAEATYERLNIEFDTWKGESFYHDDLPGVVETLIEKKIAREDNGALVVFFPEDSPLHERPFLIRKKDGAFLYSTTDLATVAHRMKEHQTDRMIYVVDVRQSLHFDQLFSTAKWMGFDPVMEHVGFGMMLGADGKPFKTRDGGTVSLAALLDEAQARIMPRVEEKWPEASAEEHQAMASKVGIGAVKYADLAQNLATDYKFDWDKLLAAEGNTGPYLQYTLVRIRSVLREYTSRYETAFKADGQPISLDANEESELAVELLKFSDLLGRVGDSLLPHLLCEYLYGVCRKYNQFFAECPILKSEGEMLRSRMTLCAATARTLEIGMSCLNLPMMERM